MGDRTIDEWLNSFPPLDIEHATVEDLMHMRMIGLTREEEIRARNRAQELDIWEPIEKQKNN